MSLHAISPEAEAEILRQRKSDLLRSVLIGMFAVVLIMSALSLYLLKPVITDPAPGTIHVTHYVEQPDQSEKTEPEVRKTNESKPTAPALRPNSAINTDIPAWVSLPPVDTLATSPSLDLGSNENFIGDPNSFTNGPDDATEFFKHKSNAERIAFVIDYSASMNGKGRFPLMKSELTKTISNLGHNVEYQMIFFAGPAWVAGEEVNVLNRGGAGTATTQLDGKEYQWTGQGAHEWRIEGERDAPKPGWMKARKSQIKKSLEVIEDTKLCWGTDWTPALEMALRMDPAPQVIFFMTDGDAGPNSLQKAEQIAKAAKAKHVTIHTVALMEPRAAEAMTYLAKKTGGQFTLIGANGEPVKSDR